MWVQMKVTRKSIHTYNPSWKRPPITKWWIAYVVLKDRLSYQHLRNLTFGLKRKERQRAVVDILKQHARITQRNVLSFLQNAESQGASEQIRKIWLINVIAFRAQPSTIYQLADNFTEIEKIFYDPKHPIEELVDDNGITKYNEENNLYNSRSSRSPQPGLTLINAPQVWAEGDSGQGVLVA
ncbi:MAG: hypothetical protein GWN00_34120, partial [Aliifodinibius sp.]|nr:hypothetical protein [Fodinibius sp.]NIV15767.1 hypothetical protein [Fodinibius sp.]NIY29641.1 hypothetical protein [Fodinibius sp.]